MYSPTSENGFSFAMGQNAPRHPRPQKTGRPLSEPPRVADVTSRPYFTFTVLALLQAPQYLAPETVLHARTCTW